MVASGENFPDALSIAPIAAQKGMPILLSSKNALPYVVDEDGNDIYSVQASYNGIASFSLDLPSSPEEMIF